MSTLNLDPSKTAVVIIDLQRAITGRETQPHTSSDIVARSSRIAASLRAKGGTAVYVHVDINNMLSLPVDQPSRPPNAEPVPPAALEIVPEAGMQTGDLLITKPHWGAFAGTPLEQELRQRGIDTVIVTGISTNIGVESTIRQGTGLGFGFIAVEDACGSADAESHHSSFTKIFPRLARVRNTDEVLTVIG